MSRGDVEGWGPGTAVHVNLSIPLDTVLADEAPLIMAMRKLLRERCGGLAVTRVVVRIIRRETLLVLSGSAVVV